MKTTGIIFSVLSICLWWVLIVLFFTDFGLCKIPIDPNLGFVQKGVCAMKYDNWYMTFLTMIPNTIIRLIHLFSIAVLIISIVFIGIILIIVTLFFLFLIIFGIPVGVILLFFS